MPTPPTTPPRAQSIEDLLKKKEASVQVADPLKQAAKVKPSTSAKTTPRASSSAEKLTEKMGDIRSQELEREAMMEAQRQGLPYVTLVGFPISSEAIAIISRARAQETQTIAFFKVGDEIRLATRAPGEAASKLGAEIAKEQRANVQIYFVSQESFDAGFKTYDALPEVHEVIYGVRIEEATLQKYAQEITDLKKLQEKISQVSISDAVALIIGAALRNDASDVHIETEEPSVKIRFRIDGDLHDAARMPRDSWKQLQSRFKLLSGVKMNIEGVPQDGRITIYFSDQNIDIRVSFLPTAFGESIVMRILKPSSIALEFEQLGVRGRAWEALQREINKPNGMIVTTGPTGSGKTTTLYAILRKLNTEDVKIITLEDPVEYKLQGINQSQIDHSKDYNFSKGLRSILRQDPDIVMVGEIRDLETAEISIQAALTGHLVISTIHTNSAAGAIPRFLSMGVPPFLLAPAINCIIGQRLVKRLNPDSKVPIQLTASVLAQVKAELGKLHPDVLKEYKVDLEHLQFFGPKPDAEKPYKGRLGIYEIFPMTEAIEKLILGGKVSEYDMIDIALKSGMITMAQDGLLKALDGLTSVEEVLRAAELQAYEEAPEAVTQPANNIAPIVDNTTNP